MEYINQNEIIELATKLGIDKQDKRNLFKIQSALNDTTNNYLGININKVYKAFLKCLKTPKKDIPDLYEYVSNCTKWIIENKKSEVYKETGRFVNVIEMFNDFRNSGIELTQLEKKTLELIYNHYAYENRYLLLDDLKFQHRKALTNSNDYKTYLETFISLVKAPLPLEPIIEKAEKIVKDYEEIIKVFDK